MILGLSSFAFGWSIGFPGNIPANPMKLKDLLDWTGRMRLNCLQIGDNLALHELGSDELSDFVSEAQRHQIRLEAGARGLDEDHLDRYIQIARYMGAPLLRFVIDGPAYKPDLDRIESIIRDRLKDLHHYSITLGIENHDRFKAKELAGLIDRIDDSRVGICLDCANSLGAGEGLDYVAEILSPFTVNLHLKDFVIRRLPHMMGFIVEGAIAGKGMVNFPKLIERVQPYARCESAVLEQWVPPESPSEHSLAKERHWANESLMYLKTFFIT